MSFSTAAFMMVSFPSASIVAHQRSSFAQERLSILRYRRFHTRECQHLTDRSQCLAQNMGNGFLVQMIHVSEKPVISCPINGPKPGNEELVGDICPNQPEFLPTFYHGAYVAHHVTFKGAGKLSERCALQRLRS